LRRYNSFGWKDWNEYKYSCCNWWIYKFYFPLFLNKRSNQKFSLAALCNGLLAGLVSITAPCNVVSAWEAFFIGLIGALIYKGYSVLLLKLKIDDPLALVFYMEIVVFNLVFKCLHLL
jgi:hypothetical protein